MSIHVGKKVSREMEDWFLTMELIKINKYIKGTFYYILHCHR